MKHTQLNLNQFKKEIEESEVFKQFEPFKKGIVLKRKNIERLYDYYQQSCRYSIDYLKQNPNLFQSDVKIIAEILKK